MRFRIGDIVKNKHGNVTGRIEAFSRKYGGGTDYADVLWTGASRTSFHEQYELRLVSRPYQIHDYRDKLRNALYQKVDDVFYRMRSVDDDSY